MTKRYFLPVALFFLWIVVCGLSTRAEAAVPHLINYQGRITDTSGNPLTGSYSLTFRIFDAETAGSLLWEETQSGVVVDKGLFGVLLGSVTALNISFDKPYFLEIKVGSEVMSPRQRITSAGYAIRAERAEQANNSDTVSNVGVNAVPAADKLLPLDSNGKLPSGPGLLGNNVVIMTGTVSHGGTIPLPAGYTQDQCKWMASAYDAGPQGSSSEGWRNYCYANSNRVVTVYARNSTYGSMAYGSANYIIVGIK